MKLIVAALALPMLCKPTDKQETYPCQARILTINISGKFVLMSGFLYFLFLFTNMLGIKSHMLFPGLITINIKAGGVI
jgi:hypothetical protein